MKVSAPKFLKETSSIVRDFYFPKFVNIAHSQKEDSVSDALYNLSKSQDIFESFAKDKRVLVSIDRGDSLLTSVSGDVNPKLKNLLDKSVVVRVTNGITGKEKHSVIDTTKDTFVYSGENLMTKKAPDGSTKQVKETYSHEDNFLRAVYRAVSYLSNLVK